MNNKQNPDHKHAQSKDHPTAARIASSVRRNANRMLALGVVAHALSVTASAQSPPINHLALQTPITLDPQRQYAPVGDFDGDGKMDVFSVTKDGRDEYWEFSSAGQSPWKRLGPASAPASALAFGDFNGDDAVDVFFADKSTAYVVLGSRGKPRPMMKLPATNSEFRFGDFNGDGRTDIFMIDAKGQWQTASAGQKGWQTINRLGGSVNDYLFADFDGDKRTDVFRVGRKGQGEYSAGGTKPWTALSGLKFGLDDLRVADLNGDGRADLFTAQGGEWLAMLSAKGKWTPIFRDKAPLSDLYLADLRGDGRSDVFAATRSRDQIAWSFVNNASTRWERLFAYTIEPTVVAPNPRTDPEPDPEPQPDPSPEEPAPPAGTPTPAPGSAPSTPSASGPINLTPDVFTRVTAPGRCYLTERQVNSCSAVSGKTQSLIATQVNALQDNLAIGCCQAINQIQSLYGSAGCAVIEADAMAALGCSN